MEARPTSLAPLSPLEPLDLGRVGDEPGDQQKDNAVPQSKRLELITNEISDDESASEKSPTSPHNESLKSESMSSPVAAGSASAAASKVETERGTAGVGLAAAGGLAVDTSLDRSGEAEEQTGGTAQSSPQGTPNQSQSGGRAVPSLGPKNAGSAGNLSGRSGLEHSQSGKSSNLSEVSEDFPSEFDHSEAPSQHGLRDTLELSATMEDSVPAPPVAIGVAAALAATEASGPGAQAPAGRLSKVHGELASLARVLTKLREIRGQQKEYLQLLQAFSGSPAAASQLFGIAPGNAAQASHGLDVSVEDSLQLAEECDHVENVKPNPKAKAAC